MTAAEFRTWSTLTQLRLPADHRGKLIDEFIYSIVTAA
jgi:hypothetical protein